MNQYSKHTGLFLLFSFMILSTYAQDPHFSLSRLSRSYYSVSGWSPENQIASVSLAYRDQWTSVQAPYKTRAAAFNKNFNGFGLKAGYWQNGTDDGGLRHSNVYFGANYRKSFDNHGMSVGLQTGLFQVSFDPGRLTFNSQYNPLTGFDPNMASNEIFPLTNLMVADVAAGLSYFYYGRPNSQISAFQADFSIFHLTRPSLSFENDFENPATQLPYKYVLSLSSVLNQNGNWNIMPDVLIQRQGDHWEYLLGGGLQKPLNNQLTGEVGLRYRVGKALIPYLNVRRDNIEIGLSFDFTQFELQAANQGNGAIELGLQYYFGNKKTQISKPRKVVNGPSDRDQDGIVDNLDSCPDVWGPKDNQGCPTVQKVVPTNGDMDQDGILDQHDDCPLIPGLVIFRGCPDTDGDGIPNKQDKCPDQYGPKVRQGCPLSDIDADGDGTPDKIDQCPSVAGVPFLKGCPDSDGDGISDFDDNCPYVFGTAEFIGCPEDIQDADGDGIKNTFDKCPYIPGIAKFQGCPDTDGDGIQDLRDACPMRKGSAENQGCPNNGIHPGGSNQAVKAISLFGPVEFDTDKAIIRPEYFQMLGECIGYLSVNPDMSVQLAGHTDYEGSASYNMVLSENRALSIKRYMVARGINPNRIQIVYYGENIPKASNESFRGRMKNRRVEIVIK